MPSRKFSKRRPTVARRGAPDRKAHQLCRQVGRVIDQLLAGELDDDVLRGLSVVSVVPAPDSSHLLVTVGPMTPGVIVDVPRVLERLHAAALEIRAEVAAAITRKKAPSLTYQVAPVFASVDEVRDQPRVG